MTSTKTTISEYTTEKLKSMEGSFVLGGEAYITKDAQVFKKSGDLWMPCREFATKGYRAVRLDDGHIYYVHKLFAEAFMESIMASMRLRDVRIVTFPKRPAVIVIEVEGYNSGEEFQLFYAPDGKLQRQLNVSELGGEIYPGLFN